jgi:hypothetical protein
MTTIKGRVTCQISNVTKYIIDFTFFMFYNEFVM